MAKTNQTAFNEDVVNEWAQRYIVCSDKPDGSEYTIEELREVEWVLKTVYQTCKNHLNGLESGTW